jgi:adenine-specific DNA-methyltransferase
MTIKELNILLNKIGEQPDRDTILQFAFSLLEWMGIAPNTNNTPQLVAPKTQKLKDYLFTAPQTIQPQLYRLNAENQNIRIRFAVLKKLKKEYVSQLVDNDPGAESYQNTPDALRLITKAPYFVHFVTTPDYNKLVLIINLGDQKRIVTFRNRLTNTQYNKIIQQWQNIASRPKPEIADLFWKSLDIKEVNKKFYEKIKENFDSLIGIAKLSKVDASENQIKQFSIRLIGRYIFCWFLKEKGIIPLELISSETIEKNKEFHQNFLQKLFFGTLNTKVSERGWLMGEPVNLKNHFERIPYLNGGLFDKTSEDEIFSLLDLNSWLLNFVDLLENYDFTVDESSAQYQHVAVDPEMLGRIFENLLASQNPETEKAANNERKAFGAFYTPRDIVDFMVNESLKTFIANKLNINADELSPAFSLSPVWPEKLLKRKYEVETLLKEIKILDPACGSGAFPMGVLHRLISLRELVSLQPNTYQLKKEILSGNIYGVDIMPMAVEIARLRAWLSLIVEEEYKGEKIAANFGIDSLPNLDFKFMQGNSLLETYEGIKIFDEKLLETKAANKKLALIEKTKEKLNSLQSNYMALHNQGKLKGTEKAILEKELKENKDLLNKILKAEEPTVNYGLFNNGENAQNLSEQLQKLQKELFNTSEKERKKELKEEIENLEWNLIATSLQESGKKDKLELLQNLKEQSIKPYFLYKLNFPEVFTEKGGFDIVIGNPPYVRQEAINPYYKPKYIENHPEVGSGTADLYVYFFDSAMHVANKGGIIIFITLNKYLKTKYGEGLRKKLKEKDVDLIIDFFELPVFEASTDTAITKIINRPDTDSTRYYPIKTLDNLDLNVITKGEYLKVLKDGTEWKFADRISISILEKFYFKSQSLQNFTEDKIYYGIKTGLNKAFIIDKNEADIFKKSKNIEIIRKYAKPTGISKWKIESDKYFLSTGFDIDIEKKYPEIFKHFLKFKSKLIARQDKGLNWWNLRSCAYYELFDKPKIIYIRTAKHHSFYLDEEAYFINDSCYLIGSDNKYLFFFLNSILFDWFKRIKFVAYGDADEGGRVKLDYNKMITVPIKQITEKQLKWFEKQYSTIKSNLANAGKVKTLENEAETMLFKIYDLTYNEVKTVCPDFWMNEQEYKNFKIEGT